MSRENNTPEWIIHCVANGITCEKCGKIENCFPDGICDAHTHGLNMFGHLELQLVIGYGPNYIGYILNTIGDRIRNGEHFSDGQLVEDIFEDCPVRLNLTKDCLGDDVLRVVIPDKDGRFPEDPACEYPYSMQTQDTNSLYLDDEEVQS